MPRITQTLHLEQFSPSKGGVVIAFLSYRSLVLKLRSIVSQAGSLGTERVLVNVAT
jgi:hypothetical protein